MKCPECVEGHLSPFSRDEEFKFDGKKCFAKNVPCIKCNICNMIATGADAAKIRLNAICKSCGLLTPEEYKQIREKLGLSISVLSKMTGFSEQTLLKYEGGRTIPDKTYHVIMIGVRDSEEFMNILTQQVKE